VGVFVIYKITHTQRGLLHKVLVEFSFSFFFISFYGLLKAAFLYISRAHINKEGSHAEGL